MSAKAHISRGIWALADKSLPMLYGAVFVLIVAQTIPMERFGVWVIFQLLWIALTQLGDYFILQPMVKLAAEDRTQSMVIVSAAAKMYLLYLVLFSALSWIAAPALATIFRAPELGPLMPWMSAMLLCNFIRNLVIRTLQIDYRIEKIFLVDVVFFVAVIVFIIAYAMNNMMDAPIRMVEANVYSAILSSLIAIVVGWSTFSFKRSPFSAVRRIYDLGIHNAGTGILQITQQQLDGVLLGLFRSTEEVGIYTVAKTYYRGFEAIRDAAGFIVLPAASELHAKKDNEGIVRLAEAGTFVLIALIVPIVIIALLAGQYIFTAIYHGTHDASVMPFRLFIVGALSLPFTIIASNILLGIGQTRPLYRITVTNTILFAVLFVVLTSLYGANGACTALSATSIVYAFTTIRGMRAFVPISLSGIKAHAFELRKILARVRK